MLVSRELPVRYVSPGASRTVPLPKAELVYLDFLHARVSLPPHFLGLVLHVGRQPKNVIAEAPP